MIYQYCIEDPISFANHIAEYVDLYVSEYPQSKIIVFCGKEKIVVRYAVGIIAVYYPTLEKLYIRIDSEVVEMPIPLGELVKYLDRFRGDNTDYRMHI